MCRSEDSPVLFVLTVSEALHTEDTGGVLAAVPAVVARLPGLEHVAAHCTSRGGVGGVVQERVVQEQVIYEDTGAGTLGSGDTGAGDIRSGDKGGGDEGAVAIGTGAI